MITKINSIKNFWIFKDFTWKVGSPDFNHYNLIYGLNGSGKTSLSNLFSALETGNIEKCPSAEYEIETQTGTIRHNIPSSRKVRVFNQNYIVKNVEVLSGKANPIFILGEENQKIIEEINKDEHLLLEKDGKLKSASYSKETQARDRDKQFTNIARIISANTSGEATRRYNKNNAELAFKQMGAIELLEEQDIQKCNLTLRQLEKPLVVELSIPKLLYHDKELNLNDLLTNIIDEAKDLSAQTVVSVTIDRLKQNSDISKWVEEGIALHGKHNLKICEYCSQPLPEDRMIALANHFNEADKKLKDDIDALVEVLRKTYSSVDCIKPADKANLYEEIKIDYQSAVQTFEDTKKITLENFAILASLLKDKRFKTTESVDLCCDIDIAPFIVVTENVNSEIRKHNAKTNDFINQKAIIQKTLEKHYLSTIYDDIKECETIIKNNESEIAKLKNGDPDNPAEIGVDRLKERIAQNKAKVSSSHKACEEINKNLKTFLGRDEIVFEVKDEGYLIKRHGVIAENLSEGEKTAIAFVYFTVHLKDQDFNISEGLVVIDDPISSFDSNSLFQAFAFLKNAVKDAKQVFLLTHNFDFLRLLLGWFNHRSVRNVSSFYMLSTNYINGSRCAEMSKIDQLLIDHESEYHYLFKKLYQFQSDGTIESVYYIPNLARKVLDTFLMFRIPNNKNIYEKLEKLNFDKNKKTAIYKFVNDQSHITGKGFDPSLVPETQNNVKYLLEMMEAVFEDHYKILVESIGRS